MKKRVEVKNHKKDLLGHHAYLGTESQGLVHVLWHFAPLSVWNQTRGAVCHTISACFVKNDGVCPYLRDILHSHGTNMKQKLTKKFDIQLFCLISFLTCQSVQ